ncbi:viroplasmin family protein [Eisenibacter elegans]|uniref:ribonuclease H1 domain-containing protein n=1 Tax=Eisenibacter elegans TaxID=997 RepID=UPI00041063A9|nr:viroplasmin family protein [Eisenibacter elegans]
MAQQKFYVVWKGRKPGVYSSWPSCEAQIKAFNGASYKSFATRSEADAAFKAGPRYSPKAKAAKSSNPPILNSLSVDAACSGNPGLMEYQGVHTQTGEQWFHQGPFPVGTNNIGEFLAIVHGLALLQKQGLDLPIYTDSQTALAWIRNKKIKTTLDRNAQTEGLFALVDRAIDWLHHHHYRTPILKWETESWGEIPADFGRKS